MSPFKLHFLVQKLGSYLPQTENHKQQTHADILPFSSRPTYQYS